MESVYNPVQKDRATFLQTAESSHGNVTDIEIELAPGGGNPLHYHTAFTEQFGVVNGQLGVVIAGTTRILSPGETALVERRQVHRFFNPTGETTTFRVQLRPASAGFENAVRIAYNLAADGGTTSKGIPRSILHLAVLSTTAETYAAGLARVVSPLLSLIAASPAGRRARADLFARYIGTRTPAAE
jgi:quercetin dioxygenase-like cupin family protein